MSACRWVLAIAGIMVVTTDTPRSTTLAQAPALTTAAAERQLADLLAERAAAQRPWNTDSKILRHLVDHLPARTAEISQTIDRLADTPAMAPSVRINTFASVVSAPLRKKLGLPAIERGMSAALAALTREGVSAHERSTAASLKQSVPSDADIDASYAMARLQALDVLGRTHLDLGQTGKAEPELREALRLNPATTSVHLALAEIEDRRRNERAALSHYLLVHALSASLPADVEARMKALYRKLHNGSEAGLGDAAERAYEDALPNPIAVSRYATPSTPTGRVALVEFFTGTGCFPCVASDLAFDALLDRYPAGTIAPLVYHAHAPEPDPMAVPASDALLQFLSGRNGVPEFRVNGVEGGPGGGPRPRALAVFADYSAIVDRALTRAPEAIIAVRAARTGDRIRVTTAVSGAPQGERALRLHVVLAERQLHFHGENGVHKHTMVVRAVAGDPVTGVTLENADTGTTVESAFDFTAIAAEVSTYLESTIATRRSRAGPSASPRVYRAEGRALTAINPAELVVVAYVRRPDKRVLQAAIVPVK